MIQRQQLEDLTVSQIAVEYPEALQVFNYYNIDYCCGGGITLKEACFRLGLDPAKIFLEIADLDPGSFPATFRIQDWSCSLIVDYIIQNHHSYVRNAIPEIQLLLGKVVAAHGEDNAGLKHIESDFNELADELLHHMNKEELVLFPAIKRLETDINVEHPLALTIQAPVEKMEHEHESAGRIIKAIRALSGNYTPPESACPTFRITYKKLEEFDRDLMTHVHLENNILFERVKERGRPIVINIIPE